MSRALDTIEQRLTTDPVLAAAVVDLPSVVRHARLDDGRPAHLLRLGMVIDALARHLSDDGVSVYPVTDRGLISELELTSNEKMVIRRWADDGLAEVLPDAPDGVAERVLEIADLTGLPVIGNGDYRAYQQRYPGTVGTSRHLLPMPGAGGVVLAPAGAGAGVVATPGGTHPALRRLWRCPDPGCAGFGSTEGGQPPPRLRDGVPACPRHGQPLADLGPAPEAIPTVVVLDGTARQRFVVRSNRPVAVGRNPEEPGVRLGLLLDEEAARVVSRSHLRMEVAGGRLAVVDTSTNGTVVLVRTGPGTQPQRVTLTRGERRELGEWDSVELHTGVELASARHWRGDSTVNPSSMLAEAPTMAIRIPRQS
ncbi:MAG: FHA domain-containing protein [Micromonosporaceae bacterium]